mgnify:CR=1 FL=1
MPGELQHIRLIIEHDDPAVPENRLRLGKSIETDRDIQLRVCEQTPERSPYLHGLQPGAIRHALRQGSGEPQLLAVEPAVPGLPAGAPLDGEMCQWLPASASGESASLFSMSMAAEANAKGPVHLDKAPIRQVKDTYPTYSAIAQDVRTGDTLCDPIKSPVILERMTFPEPVIEIAIEPKSKADQEKLGVALAKLVAEDPSFRVHTDQESGQTIIKGMGELHLDIKVDILKRNYKVDANIGAPQVAYRERLTKKAEIDYTHKKQTGGTGQFARVKLVFEPGEPGSGYNFESKIVGGSVPKEFIPGVEKGLEASRESGVLAGFPVIDFRATLIDGAYHDVDSSVLAFEIAARAAFKEGLQKAQCKLLEPIMKVEVVTPEDYMGDCIGDLNSRRGQIQGMEARGNAQVINAMVPLANMFGYVNTLRSMTQGRAAYTMTFDHYAPVPQAVADEVVAKLAG